VSNNKKERRLAKREQFEAAAQNRVYQRVTAEERRQKKNAEIGRAVAKWKEHERASSLILGSGLDPVLRRAPKLNDTSFKPAFDFLASHKPWVRPLEDWKPKGKAAPTLMKSLLRHLVVKYPAPEFLYDAVLDERMEVHLWGAPLFAHLARGGSMNSAVSGVPGRLKFETPRVLMPVPLTKKMCHVFLQATSEFNLITAVRRAQVLVHGGSRRLLDDLCQTQLGHSIGDNEEFWSGVIQWFCQQPMLAPSQVGPILDWLRNAYALAAAERKVFTMKGRTAVSVIREVERWHGELAKAKVSKNECYSTSGFMPFFEDKKIKLPGGGHHMEPWAIVELLSSRELLEEGKSLNHCVYSYGHWIRSGRTSIWSLRVDGSRQLTIEVDRPNRRILQVRGQSNRRAVEAEMLYIQRWATSNTLTVSNYR
jgi:hypothetical protein